MRDQTENCLFKTNIYVSHYISIIALILIVFTQQAKALTLEEVEDITRMNDYISQSQLSRRDAFKESAVADGQLPDPQLNVGLFNAPLDNFDLDREPNTQLRFGVNQSFPRGDTLKIRTQQTQWSSKEQGFRSQDQLAQSVRMARENYLDIFYNVGAQGIIHQSHRYFSQLVDIAESFYSVGRVNQQDVLRAQLELSRLEERVIIFKKNEDLARAELSKWLDDRAYEVIDTEFPTLDKLEEQHTVVNQLIDHPRIKASDTVISYFNEGVAIAEEQYKPGWSVGVEYRKRFGNNLDGSDRDDQMAALVKVDLPIFTDKRQDRRLSSSKHQVMAAKDVRIDELQALKRSVLREYAAFRKFQEQSELYDKQLVPDANANANASLKAYQSGVTEFTTLARARITQLDIQLEALRVKVGAAKAQARILYLMEKAES
ncbi:MAG: TolC family protein [Gammaproteobacteria bacterium]|nr:TolC family protein [Gammaproteobacteria bacterium]